MLSSYYLNLIQIEFEFKKFNTNQLEYWKYLLNPF